MSFPFVLRSHKSTPSPPALVVVEPRVSMLSYEDLFKLRLSDLSLPLALASLAQLLQTKPNLTFASFVSLVTTIDLSTIFPSKQNQDAVFEAPSHSFPLATADEIAFERKEDQQERVQRTLDVDAAILQSFPPLFALHLALGLPDAPFANKQQFVEEALEELVRLMTDRSTGEKLKAAGRLPEIIRVALGLEGKVLNGMEGWEFVDSVARGLKERVEQAQLSSSSPVNSLGNGSTTTSFSPLSNPHTRILILTHYLIGRVSSPSSFNITETSLNSCARCLNLSRLDASSPPATASSSFFTTHGNTFIAHLLVKATKILQLHGRVEREISTKKEKSIAASTVARLAMEKGERAFNERMRRIGSRLKSRRSTSSRSSAGGPLSLSIESLLSKTSTATSSSSSSSSPSPLTPPSTPPRSLSKVRTSSSSILASELAQGRGAVESFNKAAGKGRLEDAMGL